MNQLNSLILEGNLEGSVKYSEGDSGIGKASFTISVKRYCKNRDGEGMEEISYFDAEAYGNMVDLMRKAREHQGLRLVGRLKQTVWEDDEGNTRSRVFIVAEHIELKKSKEA
jgi:single-strand DNA-binding protein